ncbi:hypothetical protein [Natronospora cellulosivora (SeqCode)]
MIRMAHNILHAEPLGGGTRNALLGEEGLEGTAKNAYRLFGGFTGHNKA